MDYDFDVEDENAADSQAIVSAPENTRNPERKKKRKKQRESSQQQRRAGEQENEMVEMTPTQNPFGASNAEATGSPAMTDNFLPPIHKPGVPQQMNF